MILFLFQPFLSSFLKKTLENQPAKFQLVKKYDSYDKFNPDQFEKGSQEWNQAMINYLLDMKQNGENINHLPHSKDFDLHQQDGGNIVCKMEPYNVCYTLDEEGNMTPIGEHRPVRLLRIY